MSKLTETQEHTVMYPVDLLKVITDEFRDGGDALTMARHVCRL